jgi:pilus assembly protein CpaB
MFGGRTLFALLLAVLFAVGAVLIARRWVESMEVSSAKVPVQYAKVIVAAMDIPQWQEVESEKLKEVDWPKDAVTADMLADKNQAAGKVAVENIYAGEPISLRRVLDPKDGGVFSLRIPENKRAFTVRVNDVTGVAGFLLPDSRVDVLASKKSLGTTDEAKAETIVQNVKVLAVDQEASREKNKPIVVRSVTLEMTSREAEAVFKAADEGTVQFALRNPTDASVVKKPETSVSGNPPMAQAAPPKVQQTGPARNSFTIIRGLNPSRGSCGSSECVEQP